MLEFVTPVFEVDPEVIHNGDVISEVLRRGEVGEPTSLPAFREVNPSARRGHCSHRLEVRLVQGGKRMRVRMNEGRMLDEFSPVHPLYVGEANEARHVAHA